EDRREEGRLRRLYGRGADQRRAGDGDGRGRGARGAGVSGEETGAVEGRPGRRCRRGAPHAAPPLVLFNGYAATRLDWDPAFLGALAAHHRVICPDNAGLGDSPLPAGAEAWGGGG